MTTLDASVFPARLRQLRKQAKLTQEQLAERSGLGQTTIAAYERGNREPSLGNAISLCQVFGLSLEAFLAPVEQEPPSTP